MTGQPAPQLTVDQRHLLAMLADGDTHHTIARKVNAAPSTVQTRLSRTYRQIGARNGTHAVAIAIRAGLLPAPNPGAPQK